MAGITVGGATTVRITGGASDSTLMFVLGATFNGASSANMWNGTNAAVVSFSALVDLPVSFNSTFTYHGGRGQDVVATAGTSEFHDRVLVDLHGGADIAAIGNSTFDSS